MLRQGGLHRLQRRVFCFARLCWFLDMLECSGVVKYFTDCEA